MVHHWPDEVGRVIDRAAERELEPWVYRGREIMVALASPLHGWIDRVAAIGEAAAAGRTPTQEETDWARVASLPVLR